MAVDDGYNAIYYEPYTITAPNMIPRSIIWFFNATERTFTNIGQLGTTRNEFSALPLPGSVPNPC